MPDQRVGAALRRVVQARARDLCEYCRCPAQFATQSFTVEHMYADEQTTHHYANVFTQLRHAGPDERYLDCGRRLRARSTPCCRKD